MMIQSLFLLLVPAFAQVGDNVQRVAFGSCHNILLVEDREKIPDVWSSIADRDPGAFLWGGDIIYGDVKPTGLEYWKEFIQNRFSVPFHFSSKDYIDARYAETKSLPSYQRLLEQLGPENVHGTWDDHDFALNDGGKEHKEKHIAQDSFLDFFDLPEDDPRRSREGVYHAQYLFDDIIKVVFLDLRFFRDDYSATGDFLGDAQWEFLETELNNAPNNTELTIIVSSLQTIMHETSYFQEGWSLMPQSRERLLQTVSASSAPRVVFISGDVHHTEMFEGECECDNGDPFILPEITVSGMTHSSASSFTGSRIKAFRDKFYKSDWQVPNTRSLEMNFGEIDLNVEEQTVIIRNLYIDGEVISELELSFDDMKPTNAAPNGLEECVCSPSFPTELSFWMDLGLNMFFVFLIWLAWRVFKWLLGSRPAWAKPV